MMTLTMVMKKKTMMKVMVSVMMVKFEGQVMLEILRFPGFRQRFQSPGSCVMRNFSQDLERALEADPNMPLSRGALGR